LEPLAANAMHHPGLSYGSDNRPTASAQRNHHCAKGCAINDPRCLAAYTGLDLSSELTCKIANIIMLYRNHMRAERLGYIASLRLGGSGGLPL
jgi:hypothetical protein